MAIELQNFGDTRALVAGGGLELVQLQPGRVQVQLAGAAAQTTFGCARTVNLARSGVAVLDDPELAIAAMPIGFYAFAGFLRVDNSGAGGLAFNLNGTGAFGVGQNAGAALFLSLSPNPASQLQASWQSAAGGPQFQAGLTRAIVSGGVNFTAPTTFQFQWGQNVNNGATTIVAGSWFSFTKLT